MTRRLGYGTQRPATRSWRCGVNTAAFNPDGTRIVSAADDQIVSAADDQIVSAADDPARIWNAATGKEIIAFGHGGHQKLSSVAFSPYGTRVIGASADHAARLW